MTKEIKPGMLCFLTRTRTTNGRIVTVVERHLHSILGDGWLVESDTPIPSEHFHSDGKGSSILPARKFWAAQHQLIPIDADPQQSDNEAWFVPSPLSQKRMEQANV